jgi:hypothetical protein
VVVADLEAVRRARGVIETSEALAHRLEVVSPENAQRGIRLRVPAGNRRKRWVQV